MIDCWVSFPGGRPNLPNQSVSIWRPENETEQSTVLQIAPLIWACAFCPQAALQAGLGPTVFNAVTAVMAACVMLQLATAPAASAGPVHTAIKVTPAIHPVFYCTFFTCFCSLSQTWSAVLSRVFLFSLPVSQNVLRADLVPTASWNVTVKITAPVTEWQGRVSVVRATMDICVNTVRAEQINVHKERQECLKE